MKGIGKLILLLDGRSGKVMLPEGGLVGMGESVALTRHPKGTRSSWGVGAVELELLQHLLSQPPWTHLVESHSCWQQCLLQRNVYPDLKVPLCLRLYISFNIWSLFH